jgi:hypothetical protein
MTSEIDNTNEKLIDEDKKGNPNFYKGMPSNNPDGRPKGAKNYLTLLEEALEKQAKIEGKTYWEKLAQWSFKNPTVATSILKKYIPDKSSTEITSADGNPITINLIPVKSKEDIDSLDNG